MSDIQEIAYHGSPLPDYPVGPYSLAAIMLEIKDPVDLQNFCLSNTTALLICRSEQFWKDKFEYDFPGRRKLASTWKKSWSLLAVKKTVDLTIYIDIAEYGNDDYEFMEFIELSTFGELRQEIRNLAKEALTTPRKEILHEMDEVLPIIIDFPVINIPVEAYNKICITGIASVGELRSENLNALGKYLEGYINRTLSDQEMLFRVAWIKDETVKSQKQAPSRIEAIERAKGGNI